MYYFEELIFQTVRIRKSGCYFEHKLFSFFARDFSIGLIRRRLDLLKYLRNLDESLFCSFFLTRSIAQYTCRITWNLSATITAFGKQALATSRK